MKLSRLFLILLACPLVWASCAKPDNDGNGGGLVGGTTPGGNPGGGIKITSISDFIGSKVDPATWYNLEGTITSIESSTYGDIYVKDATGEVLVYGLTSKKVNSNDKSFESLKLKEGDKLTFAAVRAEYAGIPQTGGPAYYISHKPGEAPAPVYKDFKVAAVKAAWMELPATSDKDDFTVLHHGMKIGSRPFRNYTAYWDKANQVSTWVAYPLTRESIGYGGRTDQWGQDPLLGADEQPLLKSGYRAGNAGSYDRGHQIPSADRLAEEANIKTFYSTNMTPQDHTLNEGPWAVLETNAVRNWAKASGTDTLYVVTGCITGKSTKYCLDNNGKKVTVPEGYYKAILRLSGKEWSACAFYFENKPLSIAEGTYSKTLKEYAMSVDELEKKTGLDFFVNLPSKAGAEEASRVESANPKDKSWWWTNITEK